MSDKVIRCFTFTPLFFQDDLLEKIKSARQVINNLQKIEGWENDPEIMMTIKELAKNLKETVDLINGDQG